MLWFVKCPLFCVCVSSRCRLCTAASTTDGELFATTDLASLKSTLGATRWPLPSMDDLTLKDAVTVAEPTVEAIRANSASLSSDLSPRCRVLLLLPYGGGCMMRRCIMICVWFLPLVAAFPPFMKNCTEYSNIFGVEDESKPDFEELTAVAKKPITMRNAHDILIISKWVAVPRTHADTHTHADTQSSTSLRPHSPVSIMLTATQSCRQ